MSLIKSGLFAFLNRGSIAVFGFINFFILIRILPKEDFGAWVLFLSVATLLESIRKAFIYNPLIRFLNSSDENQSNSIIASSLILNIGSSLVTFIFLWVAGYYLSVFWEIPQLNTMFRIYSIGQLVYTFVIHFNSLSEANLQFLPTLISNLFHRIIFLIFFLVIHFSYGLTIEILSILYVFGITTAAITASILGYKYSKMGIWKMDEILAQFNYGKFTFGTNISSMIFKNTDSWMLGSIINKVAVASYNPAIRISNLFEVPLGAISSVVFPNMVKRIKEKGLDEARTLYEQAVGLSLCVLFPFVLLGMIFSESIVLLIAGEKYLGSASILQVTLLYALIVPFNRQFGITMNAIGKAHINFSVLLINTVLNALLNYFFIKQLGIIGAAYATLISYFIILVVSELILYRTLKVRLSNIGLSYLKSHVTLINLLKRRRGNHE